MPDLRLRIDVDALVKMSELSPIPCHDMRPGYQSLTRLVSDVVRPFCLARLGRLARGRDWSVEGRRLALVWHGQHALLEGSVTSR